MIEIRRNWCSQGFPSSHRELRDSDEYQMKEDEEKLQNTSVLKQEWLCIVCLQTNVVKGNKQWLHLIGWQRHVGFLNGTWEQWISRQTLPRAASNAFIWLLNSVTCDPTMRSPHSQIHYVSLSAEGRRILVEIAKYLGSSACDLIRI